MKTILTVIIVFLICSNAVPCTNIFIEGSPEKVVAKNMDWPFGQGLVLVNKRHVHKQSVFVDPNSALTWTSKYMSLTFTQTGREFPWEGMNEAGVSVNIMLLRDTILPAPDLRPAVNGLQWIQFILDTSGSVSEAIHNAGSVRQSGNFALSEHYMVCDSTAQCAVFENLNGKLVVHSGGQLPYKALTNNIYEQSVRYLQNLLTKEDPRTIVNTPGPESLNRFARGALLSKHFDPTTDAVSYAFASLENVKQGYTQWKLVFSLSSRQIHFKTASSPQIKLVKLSQFDPRCSAPTKMFNMNALQGGDISSQFVDYDGKVNTALAEMSTVIDRPTKTIVEGYPETRTKCLE